VPNHVGSTSRPGTVNFLIGVGAGGVVLVLSDADPPDVKSVHLQHLNDDPAPVDHKVAYRLKP